MKLLQNDSWLLVRSAPDLALALHSVGVSARVYQPTIKHKKFVRRVRKWQLTEQPLWAGYAFVSGVELFDLRKVSEFHSLVKSDTGDFVSLSDDQMTAIMNDPTNKAVGLVKGVPVTFNGLTEFGGKTGIVVDRSEDSIMVNVHGGVIVETSANALL